MTKLKRRRVFLFLAGAVLALLMQEAIPQNIPRMEVGPVPGGFLLSSGWTIRPAGQQVDVDTFPMSSAVSADGKFLLVLNGGYDTPSISVIDISKKNEISRTVLPDAWLGLTVASNGKIYVGGGSQAKIYELTLDTSSGTLSRSREFNGVQDLTKKGTAFVGDVAVSPDSHLLYAADLYGDAIAVINLQSGLLIDRWKTGRRPYRILVSSAGRQLIVSSWADSAVYQHDANSGKIVGKAQVGPHPTDMVWLNKPVPTDEGQSNYGSRIFVAAANTNNVYSLGVTRDGQLNPLETINVSMTPMHPLGMTPSALAFNADGTRLYVVCSDANAVAEADISASHSRVLGFIPTGWYPTAVRVFPDNQLMVLNGKGLGSKPNPKGPNPTKAEDLTKVEYVAHIQTGTVAFLPVVTDEQLDSFTKTVRENSPYRDELIYGPITDEQEAYFSRSEGHPSPIEHAIYIIKENRTYDQVLGDMQKGNGDKSLTLFGEQITPNLHRLAEDYILYDNFYENADVSAEGHNWEVAGIAPDYAVKMWPNEYASRSKLYNFEGGEPANTPPAGYLWNNALQAGVTVRDYGDWTENIPLKSVNGSRQIADVKDSALKPYVDMNYRGFDLDYSDVDRANEFIREWRDFDSKGQAPAISVVRMGNDHTQGAMPGALSPIAYVAQNDYAIGLLVDAISHSKLWSSTAIFITEDDSQDGPDHVDSHRAPAWVISPYTHRGIVDSSMYNQMSALRTVERIAGLRPMTHFDAAARPMFGTFSRQPNTQPYTAIQPKVSLTERNPANGPGAKESLSMNFSGADLANDDRLNAVLWRALKHTVAPPPTRSAFGR